MADLTKTVEIIFGAVDNTGTGLSSLSGNLNSVVDNASNITGPLSDVADLALKAETAVLALAAAYGGYAMVKAAEFEQAQIDLNKVLSDGDPAIGDFTQTVMDLGEQYGVSSAQILQGIANFKQAGFTAKEAADLQKNALDLMVAGDVDAAKSSQILISAIKGFGAEASDASRFIEALNNVSNDYATDVNQLAEGISRVAPIAKTMGFSFEETTGLLTPLIEVFGSGGEAAEALKTGLLKLVDDAKPVREALASIGVAQTDSNGQLRAGKDIFYDVAKAFETVDEKQKLFLTSQLVGIDQAPRMVLAFDNLAKVNQITASAMAETGSAAKEVELRLNSTQKQADSFKVSFDNLAISIGTGLNTQFNGVIAGSTDVVQALRQIADSGGLAGFFDALKPVVAEFSTTLQNIAKNLPAAFNQVDFSGLLASFKDLGFEISGVFDGIDLNTPEGLARAIQFVVDSFESLTRITSGVISAWSPLVREFIRGIEAFNGLDDASKKTFGSVSGLANIFETFKSTLTGGFSAIDTIGKALTAIAGIKAAETLIGVSGAIKGIEFAGAATGAERLVGLLGTAGLATAGVAAAGAVGYGAGTGLSWAIDGLLTKLSGSETSLGTWIYDLTHAKESANNAQGAVQALGAEVSSSGAEIKNAGDGIRDYDAEVQKAAEGGSWFADAVNEVATGLVKTKTSAESAAQGFKTLDEAQQYAAEHMAGSNNVHYQLEGGLWKIKTAAEAAAGSSEALGDTSKTAAKKASEGSEEWKRVQDVLLETQKQTNDFTVKMGELANKKYEIDVKAAVDLRVAQIVADTQRIQAAFEATSQAISDLTQGATDLWSSFSSATSTSSKWALEDAALRMEKRLDEELELKKQMTAAQIDMIALKRDALLKNGGQIIINADTLAPELQLVMRSLVEHIQIQANMEGLEMLL